MSVRRTAPPRKVSSSVNGARPTVRHFRVRVYTWTDTPMQRILVQDDAEKPHVTRYLTIQDAEYLIRQLQRAIQRAPRAR